MEAEKCWRCSATMEAEKCWRCSATMEWRHGTWQCCRCRFKLGCCEGDPQTNCEAPAPRPEGTLEDEPSVAALALLDLSR